MRTGWGEKKWKSLSLLEFLILENVKIIWQNLWKTLGR